jgi:iron(III) transport system substrate-binding protein
VGNRHRLCVPAVLAALAVLTAATPARAEQNELNLYSARHYRVDARLYAHFTEKTGIKVNVIEGKEDELLERITREGAHGPADVFITTDAARIGQADALGLFEPVRSKVLDTRIPANVRTRTWFAFSTRARLVVYDRTRVKPSEIQSYDDLANPRLKGKVCVRSGTHPYNLSLGAARIAHVGEARTEAWVKGLVANFARAPKGGDTDQIRAVAEGECQVALVNSYYLARMLSSGTKEDSEAMRRVGFVWPDQGGVGTHVNVSGGGVLKSAPHKDAAIKFLEYLAGDDSQAYFATANNEWPVVPTAKVSNPGLSMLGTFKADELNVGTLSTYTARAQEIFERAGWR